MENFNEEEIKNLSQLKIKNLIYEEFKEILLQKADFEQLKLEDNLSEFILKIKDLIYTDLTNYVKFKTKINNKFLNIIKLFIFYVGEENKNNFQEIDLIFHSILIEELNMFKGELYSFLTNFKNKEN